MIQRQSRTQRSHRAPAGRRHAPRFGSQHGPVQCQELTPHRPYTRIVGRVRSRHFSESHATGVNFRSIELHIREYANEPAITAGPNNIARFQSSSSRSISVGNCEATRSSDNTNPTQATAKIRCEATTVGLVCAVPAMHGATRKELPRASGKINTRHRKRCAATAGALKSSWPAVVAYNVPEKENGAVTMVTRAQHHLGARREWCDVAGSISCTGAI